MMLPVEQSVPQLADSIARIPGNRNGKFKTEKELVDIFIKLNP